MSFRLKIVASLIGLSLLSFALGAYYTRSVVTEHFSDVVILRYAEDFLRDALEYYGNHGSWALAHEDEPFNDYSDRINLQPPPPPILTSPDVVDDLPLPPKYAMTDLDGVVWIGGDSFDVGEVISGRVRENSILVSYGGEDIGYLVPVGEVSTTIVEEEFYELLAHAWWLSLGIVALIAVPIGLLLGNHFTGSLNNLIQAIGAMGPQSVRQSVPVKSNDELGLLSKSFNQMSADLADFVQVTKSQRKKISETETVLRQSLANVSHELRTPLFKSVSQAYAMLDGVRDLNNAELRKLITSLDYLTGLVDDLYQLSLADVEAVQFDLERIDFVGLIQDCLSAAEEDFAQREFVIELSMPDVLDLNGDKTRLRQILENLFSNCVRYAMTGSSIRLELTKLDGFAILLIEDSGPGVPDDCLEFLFDRFYRVDSSRSRESGGTGLGLSLVKTCAELHGGEVEACRSKLGGLAIRVIIPLSGTTVESAVSSPLPEESKSD